MKAQAQLPAKISVHPADTDFFTSMPCLLPNPADTGVNFHRQYFGVKEVHRIEGAVPSLGSDLMLYDAKSGELLALMDSDWITTMRTGAVAAVSAKALRKTGAETYAFVGLDVYKRQTLEFGDSLSQPERGSHETDTPASHGISLRHTVDDAHAVFQFLAS